MTYRIGFIGLGLMGRAMVSRLQDKGYALTVLGNRDRSGIEAALTRGATEANTAAELAQNSDVIMLCMGTSAHVEGRMRGDEGVLSGLQEGSVVIDFGTSLPASTRALGAEVSDVGAAYLDAPLGRTPAHAVDGLLNIMCSGDEAAFAKVKPVLEDLGENVFHLGALGSGHTIKLMNNFFGMTVANAMAEAFAVADIAGIDRQALYDVVAAGPLRSGMMDFVSAYALSGDPNQLAFSIRNAAKDVGYYTEMTEDLGVRSIMAIAAKTGLNNAVDGGRGEDMVSQMVDFYKDRYSE